MRSCTGCASKRPHGERRATSLIRRKMCAEGCGKANYGLPSERKRSWCAGCASKRPDDEERAIMCRGWQSMKSNSPLLLLCAWRGSGRYLPQRSSHLARGCLGVVGSKKPLHTSLLHLIRKSWLRERHQGSVEPRLNLVPEQ